MNDIRILVVDDHPMFRLGLIALLGAMDGMCVVGEAATLDEAVAAVSAGNAVGLTPDVVVMDLHLGDDSGIAATREILAHSPSVGVLVVTMLDDDDSIVAALRAGARGYLLKGAGPAEIERAIRAVAAGEVLLAPDVAARAMPALMGGRRGPAQVFAQLTEREHEVLELVAQGLDNLRISRRLALSDKTVRNHVSNIFTKLGVADRGAAIAKARDAGLGTTS